MDIFCLFLWCHLGNKFVQMMVDQFTMRLELQAPGVQVAVTVAQAFFEISTVRFRVLFVIHTNQGKTFDGNFSANCCRMWRYIWHFTGLAPMVKSRDTISKWYISWDAFYKISNGAKYLPVLGMALWVTVNCCTMSTSNMLPLGNYVKMPADILLWLSQSEELSLCCSGPCVQKNLACKASLAHKLLWGPFVVKVVLPNNLYCVGGQRKEETIYHDRLCKRGNWVITFWVANCF